MPLKDFASHSSSIKGANGRQTKLNESFPVCGYLRPSTQRQNSLDDILEGVPFRAICSKKPFFSSGRASRSRASIATSCCRTTTSCSRLRSSAYGPFGWRNETSMLQQAIGVRQATWHPAYTNNMDRTCFGVLPSSTHG